MSEADPQDRPRLPDLSLPDVSLGADGATVPLRLRRHGTVLVLLGATIHASDGAVLDTWREQQEALAAWDGRVLVVVPDALAPAVNALQASTSPFPVVLDEAGAIAAAAGVAAPALVITDQWGEVHASRSITPDAPWMETAEVEQWLRFLAIRCAG